jgi:two-component system sensor histidine kinase HydH
MDLLGQSSLFVAVLSFALGITMFARNVRNRVYVAFWLVCTLVSLWALFFFLEVYRGGHAFYRLHLLANIWLAPVAIYFIKELLRVKRGPGRIIYRASGIVSSILTVVLWLLNPQSGFWLQAIYFAPVFIVLETVYLIWIDARSHTGRQGLERPLTSGMSPSRRTTIYVGAILVLSCSVMDHVPSVGRLVPSIGNALLVVYLFFVSQAISQQRFLNFGAILSRFLVLLAVALTLTGLYSLLFAWIQDRPALFFLNSFIVSLLVLALLDPLRSLVRYLSHYLLSEEHKKLAEKVSISQQQLTGSVELESILATVSQFLESTLIPEALSFYILNSDATQFQRTWKKGKAAEMLTVPQELLVDHALIQHLRTLRQKNAVPILVENFLENERDRNTSRTRKERWAELLENLRALQGNLLIPFLDEDTVMGFAVVTVNNPPEGWGTNWGLLSITVPFFESVGRVLRSLEVYSRQKEKDRLAGLGEMAAGLAHEIRNPLGAIRGAAQLLDHSPTRPDAKFAQVIIEEVDRLNRVVTQFLDYARRDSQKMERLDLIELVSRTVDLLKPTLEGKIQIVFNHPKNPIWVLGNGVQLRQLILNLLQNAVHAVQRLNPQNRAPEVKVSLSAGAEVSLMIEDNGGGISKENLSKIFIPFFTTSPQGTGLGLSICHKIVELHEGRIEVQSEEGKFARFTVILPGRKLGDLEKLA